MASRPNRSSHSSEPVVTACSSPDRLEEVLQKHFPLRNQILLYLVLRKHFMLLNQILLYLMRDSSLSRWMCRFERNLRSNVHSPTCSGMSWALASRPTRVVV